jgi:Ca-activated chloride channel family protein
MMMKKNYTDRFLLAFCLLTAFAFYNFSVSKAQTTTPQSNSRVRQVDLPTPTPTSPKVTPTPASKLPDEDDVIKIDTELVNLNVRVIDRNNRPISNLRQEDFKVYEDNVAQQIEFFTKSEVPTNYSLVIDNSGSLARQLEKVIEASKIIVGTNRPDDETSVIRFVSSDKIEILQDFTSNKIDLNDALDGMFKEGGQTAIIDAVYLAAEKVNEYEKSRDPNDRKRRALILISDGEDRTSFYKEKQLFDLLKEIDVQIYTVGFVEDLDKQGGFISKSPQGKAKAFLERLATETGGKSYFPNDVGELNNIAADISRELRTQYSIGYIPTNDKKDGTLRAIKVMVADGPDKQKRIAVTRSGRVANNDKTSAPTLRNK